MDHKEQIIISICTRIFFNAFLITIAELKASNLKLHNAMFSTLAKANNCNQFIRFDVRGKEHLVLATVDNGTLIKSIVKLLTVCEACVAAVS